MISNNKFYVMNKELEVLFKCINERFLKVYLGAVVKFNRKEPDVSIYVNSSRIFARIGTGPSSGAFMIIHPHYLHEKRISNPNLSPQDKEFFSKFNAKYIAVMTISNNGVTFYIYRNKTFEKILSRSYPLPKEIILPEKLSFDVFLEVPPGLSLEEELKEQGVLFEKKRLEELFS